MASQYEIVAEEWKERARELAEWAMLRLVNRKDVWGQYGALTPGEQKKLGRTYKAMTLPVASKRGPDMVTLDKLTRHFASRHQHRPQIIGLHAKSQSDTSLWMGIDIDMHDDNKADAEDHARRNLVGALQWWRQLQSAGYDPLLFDSNGNGGYHLWVLFEKPAPTEHVFAFAWSLVSTWQQTNLSEEPETFPKKLNRSEKKKPSLGAWFRLPGLHHTRDHYGKLWSGDDWLDDPWLSGHAAIDVMLQCVPGPPPPAVTAPAKHSRVTIHSSDEKKTAAGADISLKARSPASSINTPPTEEQPFPPKRASQRKSRFKRSARACICVDLDGVLAQHSGGHSQAIGEPMDGAIEFSRNLAQFADIVIFTARLSQKRGVKPSQKLLQTKARVERWLTEHGISYHSVYCGVGKPLASAYIDDRAVCCQPQTDGIAAFEAATSAAKQLCS